MLVDNGGRRGIVGDALRLWDSELVRKHRRAKFSTDLVFRPGKLDLDLDLDLLVADSLRALLCIGRDLALGTGVALCLCEVELSRCRYCRAILLTDAYDEEVFCDVAMDLGVRYCESSPPSDAGVITELKLLLLRGVPTDDGISLFWLATCSWIVCTANREWPVTSSDLGLERGRTGGRSRRFGRAGADAG